MRKIWRVYCSLCTLKIENNTWVNLIFTHLTLNITLKIQLKFIKITDQKQQSNNSYSLFSHWDVQPITHPLPSHDQYTDLLSNNKGIALKLTVRYPPNLKFCVRFLWPCGNSNCCYSTLCASKLLTKLEKSDAPNKLCYR